jgi:hypothetical protein
MDGRRKNRFSTTITGHKTANRLVVVDALMIAVHNSTEALNVFRASVLWSCKRTLQ